jgi:hypothetical protein
MASSLGPLPPSPKRQYAHFVVAGIQFEKSITLFVSPLLFLFFIKDESSKDQWRNVFLGMAIVLIVVSPLPPCAFHPHLSGQLLLLVPGH